MMPAWAMISPPRLMTNERASGQSVRSCQYFQICCAGSIFENRPASSNRAAMSGPSTGVDGRNSVFTGAARGLTRDEEFRIGRDASIAHLDEVDELGRHCSSSDLGKNVGAPMHRRL